MFLVSTDYDHSNDDKYSRDDGFDGLSKFAKDSFDSSDDEVTTDMERIRFKAARNSNKKKRAVKDKVVERCKCTTMCDIFCSM